MSTLSKAKELLAEIDKQIRDMEREHKSLQSQRKDIARLAQSLSGGRASAARSGKPGRRGKRTDWNQVVARFKGSFTLNDLAKASGKAKGTVNQAVQKLKKDKKIVPTGKRGEYKRVLGLSAAPKAKKAAPKPKAKKRTKAKKQSKPKAAAAPQAPQESSSGASA